MLTRGPLFSLLLILNSFQLVGAIWSWNGQPPALVNPMPLQGSHTPLYLPFAVLSPSLKQDKAKWMSLITSLVDLFTPPLDRHRRSPTDHQSQSTFSLQDLIQQERFQNTFSIEENAAVFSSLR